MNKFTKVAAAVAVTVLAADAFALREISFMTAMPAKTAPVIDGAVDDACWKEGVVNTTYYEFNKVNPKKYQYQTSCTVVYDANGIYVGVVNFDPSMKTLKRNVVKHNDPQTWTDDSAEIYFDPKANGEGYYKYVVNSAGKCDTTWRMDAANYHSGWLSPGRQVAAKMFDDRWEFELFIPWEDFHGLSKPDAGTVWTFAHLRFRFASGQPEFGSSSPGAAGAAPQNFGYLYFSDGAPVEPRKVLDIVKARAKPVWGMEIAGKTYLCDATGIKAIECTLEELSRRDAEEKRIRDEKAKASLKKMLAGGDEPVEALPLPLAGTYDFTPPKDYDGYNGFYRHNPDPKKYVTSHHPWRTDGSFRPRVLFMTGFDATLRDAIELAERFPIEASYFPGNFGATGIYQDPISLGGFIDKERQFESLLARNPEIVVFDGFRYDMMPVHYKAEMIRRVRDEGMGLVVLMQPNLARRDFAKLKSIKTDVKGELVFRLGKGIVVLAGSPGVVPPWSLTWKAKYERRAAYCWNLLRRVRGLEPDAALTAEGEALVAAASDAGGLTLEGDEAVPEGGALKVAAKLAKPLDVDAVFEAELATSPHGDVVKRWRVPMKAGADAAAFGTEGGEFPTLAGVVSARVVAADDGRELARAKRMFFFPNHRYQDYTTISWDGTRGTRLRIDGDFTELFAPQLVDLLGYDNHLGGDFRTSAAFNSWIVPYRCRINIDKARDSRAVRWEIISRAGFMVPFDKKEIRDEVKAIGEEMNPYDPRVRSIVERGFGDIVRQTLPYGVAAWNLGDECYYKLDAGHGEQDRKPFAEFLKWKYGTVEKFNEVHGTKCVSFADAPHLTIQQAIDANDRPAWWDHVQYMEKMYRDTMEFVSSVIKKYDPKARVGAEGSVPGDLELTVKNLEFWGPYRSLVGDELLRNVAPDHLRGVWWGGYISSLRDGYPVQMWDYLLTGTVNADQFFQCVPGGTLSAFGGDLAPAPYVQKMVPHLMALKRGVAQLLIRTPFRYDGFAMYHSHASASAAKLVDTFRTPEATLAPLIRFCYRRGYAVKIVTPRTLGRLDGVKVLFLSGATVLSDEEVAALKTFAAKGGVIATDVEAGVMDDFFVSRASSPLTGIVKPMPDVSDDNAVQSFLTGCGVAANLESVAGLAPGRTVFRVREKDGCRIVGFKTVSKSLGSRVTVDFGRRCRVYEVDRGFVGETDKVEIASLDVPFKLYAAFDGEPEFFRKGAVYRREVIAPGGMPVAHREKVFVYDGTLPPYTPALNDAAGEWSLVYRDIATGRTLAKPF